LCEKGDDKDPLTQAFHLNKEVRQRAKDERELKKEYLKLSEECKTFATDLYNSCQSFEEFAALLGVDVEHFGLHCNEKMSETMRTSVVKNLRRAVDSEHIEVC
jgi:hypothetical protein